MKPAAQSFLRFPLNLVFDSPANVRVLRALARHGGMLSASALAEATNLTKPSVLSALGQLAKTGPVEVLGSDRQRLYRFDENGPLGAALVALFAAENQSYRNVLETIRNSAEELGAEAAWVYGSVANGQDGPGSDIDIAVVGATGAAAALAKALRDRLVDAPGAPRSTVSVIGVDARDIARLERDGDPWWLDLKRDAMVVLGPAPDAYIGRSSVKLRKGR
jgi:predicted nucleotidyltransferase